MSPEDIRPSTISLVSPLGVALEEQAVADEDPAGLPLRQRAAVLVEDLHDRAVAAACPPRSGRRAGPRAWRSRRRPPRSSRRCCRGCRRSGPSTPAASVAGSAEPDEATTSTRLRSMPSTSAGRGPASAAASPGSRPWTGSARPARCAARWPGRSGGAARPSSRTAWRGPGGRSPTCGRAARRCGVRQPARSGIRESRETAASMPASLRGAPLGVPVVPEVRITMRAWRSGGCRSPSSYADTSCSSVSGPSDPPSPSVHARTRRSTWAPASRPVNSSSCTTRLGASRSSTSTSCGPAKAVLRYRMSAPSLAVAIRRR